MFAENLDIFLNTDEHADSIVFAGSALKVIDSGKVTGYSELDGTMLETWTITGKTTELSCVFGEKKTVDGASWNVGQITDDSGMRTLQLVRRAS